MAQEKSYYIISYDICDSKRLNKIAKIMVNYCERVLYSVFEGELTHKQKIELQQKVSKIMMPEEDSIIYFRLCSQCVNKIKSAGKRIPIMTDDDFMIV
jgi:CRISPR-associated protein Cas2